MFHLPLQLTTLSDSLKRWLMLLLTCLGGSLLFLWLTTPMAVMQEQEAALTVQSEPAIVFPGTTSSLTVTIRYTLSSNLLPTHPFTLYYFPPSEEDGLIVNQTAPDDPFDSNGLHPAMGIPVRSWEIDQTAQSSGTFTIYLNVLETAPSGIFTHETWLVNAAAPDTIILSAATTTTLTTTSPVSTTVTPSPTATITPTTDGIPNTESITLSPVPTIALITNTPTWAPNPLPINPSNSSPTVRITEIPSLPQVIPTLALPTPEPTSSNNLWGGQRNQGLFALLIGILGIGFIIGLGGIFYLWQRNRRKPDPHLKPTPQTLPTIPLTPIPPSATAYLTDVTGRQITITDPAFTIGRGEDNHLVIDAHFPEWETVSHYHATISRQPRGYIIEDRSSRNGLRVQGRATPKNLLQNGYTIQLGDVSFTFHQAAESGGRV